MRVLLTGATGLIGRQTARALEKRGHSVIALSRTGLAVAGASETLAVDLLDGAKTQAALEAVKADGLIHLAWYGGPGRMSSPENIDWAAATLRLVSDFASNGGKHVVAAGSCAEYDWSAREVHCESDQPSATSVYGLAKQHTGHLLTGSAEALNLSIAWARIFFVYGPGEPKGRLFGDLLSGLRAGRPVPCSDGEQVRDFLHSSDVASALVACLEAQISGPVNIASGKGTRVRDMIEETAKAFSGAELIQFGAIPRPASDPARLIGDASRLNTETDFQPGFDIQSGIADVVKRADQV